MMRPDRLGIILGLIVVAAGIGGYLFLSSRPPARPATSAEPARGTISVFFPDDQGRLAKKIVEVHKQLSDRARADILFRELKEARSIPDRLRLYEMAAGEDGVLYLNVSKEFCDPETPAREVSMVYAMVNSYAASFPNTERVQLLVEGQPVYTRSGLLYIFEPLRPSKELLED
ncbi:MAG: GerMN domain-containing protein [Syntrophorhabdales bacterium]|jgi:hypothetical protein